MGSPLKQRLVLGDVVECPECEDGMVPRPSLNTVDHYDPCPACRGVGVVVAPEAIETLAKAMFYHAELGGTWEGIVELERESWRRQAEAGLRELYGLEEQQ